MGEPFAAYEMTGDWTLRQRLTALAHFRPIFERPESQFGKFIPSKHDGDIIILGGFDYTNLEMYFIRVVCDYGWIRELDWPAWLESERGTRLMRDPEAMSGASEDDLAYLITACVRAERFCDGALSGAYNEGLLMRIVIRAEELLRQLEAVLGNDPAGQMDHHAAVKR